MNSEKKLIRGFTMIEILITLTVAAILAALAIPSFTEIIRNTRLTTASTLLTSDLNLGRGEAIKRNARILVCAKIAALDACDTGTNWATGWIICYDIDANGACDAATTGLPNPILIRPAINSTLTLTGTASLLQFAGTGGQAGANPPTFQFTLSGNWSGAASKSVSVARSGGISGF